MAETKCCTKCGIEKPLSLFGKGERNKNIRKPQCKACVVDRQRGWEFKNAERHAANPPCAESIRCRLCGIEKEGKEFGRRANTKSGIETACYECLRKRDRERYIKHTEKRKQQAKWGQLKKKFGLSKEQWLKMVNDQNNRCAICFVVLDPACVDHDHESGVVRGILCIGCNAGIGSLGDSSLRLEAAASYLKRYGK